MATKRGEARHRGGTNRKAGVRTQHGPYTIKSVGDIMDALQDSMNDASALENSHARARTIGYLCQIALKGLEVGDLESRIAALEQILSKRQMTPTRRGGGNGSSG